MIANALQATDEGSCQAGGKVSRLKDPNTTVRSRALAMRATQDRADQTAARIGKVIVPLYRDGVTLDRIAQALNISGYRSGLGNPWGEMTVRRFLVRLHEPLLPLTKRRASRALGSKSATARKPLSQSAV